MEELLQKYLDGDCSEAEIRLLYEQLQGKAAYRSLLTVMQADFERILAQRPEVPAALSDRMEMRLLQAIGQTDTKQLGVWYRWKWIAAAASVALLVTAGTYFFIGRKPASPLATGNMALHDIAPGSNKAVLTLADGVQVTLDSAGHQVIQQGNTTVQQKMGQLQYAAAGKTAAIGYNLLTVPRGGQFTVVLPDGSQVWLNAASSLRYPTAFTGKQRIVELQGEGYFDIKPQAQQPFIVRIVGQEMEVQVLGTHFNIMAYTDEKETTTTLVQGAVKVKKGAAEKYLQPGQQAAMDHQTGTFTVQETDVAAVTAWQTGFFEFDNAGISAITRQLARWYDIEIDNKTGDSRQRFGGRINKNLPLSEMLHMLAASGVTYKLEGRKLTVTATR
ncbi:FecR family protein [Chitinophaga nivalis]|uniref:FecR domain-containing protein n=1 Tax=Chitinophaga nivalis TaxID=2991709 RepID=A0ABT3IG86_9BACT|nr:FecR family protein [Chitinophaga nivalis]MCW3467333.1 FecR domain-containing protein [Chitinophaga nivalis]MCW3482975.1 FecR domain-containing protein [Chitinophaga nivalis]